MTGARDPAEGGKRVAVANVRVGDVLAVLDDTHVIDEGFTFSSERNLAPGDLVTVLATCVRYDRIIQANYAWLLVVTRHGTGWLNASCSFIDMALYSGLRPVVRCKAPRKRGTKRNPFPGSSRRAPAVIRPEEAVRLRPGEPPATAV